MPFDPTKSFEVVEEPPASTFDPKKPFSVIPPSGFDPSKPYEVVGETASLRPTTPAPGQQTQPVAPVEGFAGVPQAFPAAEQRQADLTAQAGARQPPLPTLGQVDITAAARQEPESPEAEIQPIGKPGTLLYGASEVAASVLNRPEYLAAMLNPATAAAVGLRYAPGVAKQFIEDLGKASQGDDQALGRAAMIGIPALVGAVRGGRSITQRMAAQTALERARSASAASSIDALARLELNPPTMLKRSEAELSKIPGERTTDASKVSETTEVHGDVRPFPVQGEGEVPVKESGAGVQSQAERGLPEARPDDTGAKAAAAAVQRDVAEAVGFESNDSIVQRTAPGAERDAAFANRAKALKQVALTLKPGDVIITDDGGRLVVDQVMKDGTIFAYKEGSKAKGGQVGLSPDYRIERQIKPAPAAPEQAPPTEAPTTAAVSAAKEGVGETAPSPSAIPKPTISEPTLQASPTGLESIPENTEPIPELRAFEYHPGDFQRGLPVYSSPNARSELARRFGIPNEVGNGPPGSKENYRLFVNKQGRPIALWRERQTSTKPLGGTEVKPVADDPIVAAAFRAPNGKVVTGLQGREFQGVTHMEADMAAQEQGLHVDESMAGFVTRSGKFLTREQAYEYAKKASQLDELKDDFEAGKLHTGKVTAYASTAEPTPTPPAQVEGGGAPKEEGARGPYLGRYIDDSFAEQQKGFPKAKETLKGWSNDALEQERRELVKASLNPMFGANAKRTLNLIEDEIASRKPSEKETGTAPTEPTWMGKPLSYWKANAVPQKLGKSEWRTQLSKALGVKDTPASVAKGLKGVIRDLEAQQAKEQRKLENQKADQRDADQEALISKIETGEPVEKSEVDRLLQPDSEWRKKAIIKSPPEQPPIVGMGGAVPTEFAPGGAAGMDIYGIAERVREQRAKAGQTLPVESGEGISAPDSVERGRELLRGGADAEASMTAFERTKKLSADDMALARAKGEALFQQARQIESKFGTESQEYLDAFKRASDWDKRSKAMQTEWHKMGQAQQGETDIDTGTFTGLQRAFGEEFTPKQAKVAKEHVAKVQKAEAEAAEAKAKLTETLKALEKAQAEKPKISSYVLKVAERWVAEWGKEAEKARKALAGKFLSPSPEDLLNLARIARYDIAQIGLDFAKWTEKMVREFGPKVQPYLADAWAKGQELIEGKVKQVRDKEVGQQIKRQITKAPDPVVDLWKRAKAMIDGGETDPQAVFNKLATETGRPVGEVRELLTKPKTVKKLSDEMYIKMAQRRRVISAAKAWVKNEKTPGWLRFMRSVPRIFFIDKIFGHGTVGMITHAGLNIFNPSAWRTYWPAFIKQYGLVFKPAYHERMMQDLMADPLYVKARRAGLANDPYRYADDYQNAVMQTFMNSKLGRLAGGEGFDALKLFRQARFNQLWNALPDTLKTDAMARMIADSTNHATGIVNSRFPEWSGWAFFAPKLEASRWAWAVKDSAKAGEIISRWKKATPEERRFAMTEVREKATIAGFYFGLLALNQGLLSATGSKEQINFTNPRRGDFLAFKIAGHKVGVVGPMLGMVRLLAELVHESMGQRTNLEKLHPRASEMGSTVFSYARGKLSPFAGQVGNVMSQADFQGRPLPWSSDQAPAYLRKRGQGRYTYPEYFAQEFTPIPVSEAIREVWADQGMNENAIATAMKALTIGVVAGGTGARITKDFTPTPSTVK